MTEKPMLENVLPPIPINACWKPGPALGNDPCERDQVECGDRFLVLVHCCSKYYSDYWDAHVVVATEDGWDDTDGESWGAWSWEDVSWYFELTKSNMPQLGA